MFTLGGMLFHAYIIKINPLTMFPNYKKKLWWKVPDGWEDLGLVEPVRSISPTGQAIISTDYHVLCGKDLSIGREDGKAFRFCKRCLVKL